MKNKLLSQLMEQAFLTQEQSWMLFGLVFGWKVTTPTMYSHYLEITGMQHVAAASGFNVGLIIAMVRPLISRFSPFYKFLILLLVVVGYVLLTDRSAAIVRAALMALVAVAGRYLLKRQYCPWRALTVVTVGMGVLVPTYWQSISFQLSIAATAGIILLGSRFSFWVATISGEGKRIATKSTGIVATVFNQLKDNTITTMAAQATTAPLIFHHFGALPTITLMANATLLSLIPSLTQLGFGLVAVAFVSRWCAPFKLVVTLLGWLFKLLLRIFEVGLVFFAGWNWPVVTFNQLDWSFVWVWWFSCVFISVFLRKISQREKKYSLWFDS